MARPALKIKKGIQFDAIPFSVLDSDASIARIRHFVKTHAVQSDATVLSIALKPVLSHQFKLDSARSDWDIYQSIRLNLSHYFPGLEGEADFFIDFETLYVEHSAYELHRIIQVFAVNKTQIEPYTDKLKSAGLHLKCIDIDALAIGEALKLLPWNQTPAFSLEKNLKIVIVLEAKVLWLIKYSSEKRLDLKDFSLPNLEKNTFLILFKAFIGDELLETPPVFIVGTPSEITAFKDFLDRALGIESASLTLNTLYPFEDESLLDAMEIYPLSFLVHHGLRQRYGH